MMLAIPIWGGLQPIAKNLAQKKLNFVHEVAILLRRTCGIAATLGIVFVSEDGWCQPASNPVPSKVDFALRAKDALVKARDRYQSDTNSVEAAWHFSRACFDLAEFAASNADRAELGERGIAVARQLVARHPSSAEGHYYLAMNMGQLARTKTFGALRLVPQMETEFSAARRFNERFDHAGPDRNLGLLYLEAPSFGSIGNRGKAREHLRRAVELEPDYPENRLILIEAFLRWGDTTAAAREFKTLSEGWSHARQKFAAENWTLSWLDWDKRFEKLKAQLGEAAKKLENSNRM
jgi:tetratricopeptide (TPR) repeat protein